MKKHIILAALISASPLIQAATTVNYTAGPGERDVVDSAGTSALDDGNEVRIGFFTPGFDITAFSDDLLALADEFTEYDSTTIQTIFGQPGRFASGHSLTDPVFNDEQIYIWIFETDDDGSPDSTYSNVIGHGLYSADDPNWLFPATSAIPPGNVTSVTSSEVTTAYYGTFDGSSLYLAPIPEPGTLVLLVLGLGNLLLLMRRPRVD